MKKIVTLLFIIIVLLSIYIINQLEIPLMLKTITEDNYLKIAEEISESNLNETKKVSLTFKLLLNPSNYIGKKVKDL